MKLIIMVLLSTFIIISCESGPVEPNIKIDSKEDSFKQEQRLKKRFEKIHENRRKKTKDAVKVQEKRRKFLIDTKDLENTDDAKVDYYLEMAKDAQKALKMYVAIKYAKKVLNIDPKNIEAKKILRSYSRILSIARRYAPSRNMYRENKKMAKEAKANIQTEKGKNLYENFKNDANKKAPKHFRFEDAFKKEKRR